MVRSASVALLRTVILASGTSAPDASMTDPDRDELSDWARIGGAIVRMQIATNSSRTEIPNRLFFTRASKVSFVGLTCMIALSQGQMFTQSDITLSTELRGKFAIKSQASVSEP